MKFPGGTPLTQHATHEYGCIHKNFWSTSSSTSKGHIVTICIFLIYTKTSFKISLNLKNHLFTETRRLQVVWHLNSWISDNVKAFLFIQYYYTVGVLTYNVDFATVCHIQSDVILRPTRRCVKGVGEWSSVKVRQSKWTSKSTRLQRTV